MYQPRCIVRPSRPSCVSNRAGALRCHATATARVSLRLPMNTKLGESLAVVGSPGVLGQWDASKAAALQWTEGSVWTSDLDLPVGEPVEYKYIVRRDGGSVTWQAGANMVLTLPMGALTAEVCDTWQGVHESVQLKQQEEQVEAALAAVTTAPDSKPVESAVETAVAAVDAPASLAATVEPVAAAAAAVELLEAQNAAEASEPSTQPLANQLNKMKEEAAKARLSLEALVGEKGRLAKLAVLSLLGLGSTSALVALFLDGKASLF